MLAQELPAARAAPSTYTTRTSLLSPLGVCSGVLYETWQHAFKDSSLEGSAHQAERYQPASPQRNDHQQAVSDDSHVSESPEKAATRASPCMMPFPLLWSCRCHVLISRTHACTKQALHAALQWQKTRNSHTFRAIVAPQNRLDACVLTL